MGELTHFNKQGRARMVDVTEKAVTHRRAAAAGEIRVSPETMVHIKNGTLKKGDVLAVAQVAGIQAAITCTGVTGVEMEALTAVSVAALTVYDMCKAVQKNMEITNIRLLEKSGGKSGDYKRED